MRLVLLSLLTMLPLVAAAQVYRWVDEQGKVHFTQTPPPKGTAKAERQPLPAAPRSAGAGAPGLGEYAARMQVEREQREKAQAKVEKVGQQRRQNCGAAKRRQAFLNRYDGRMRTITADGGEEAWAPERYAVERGRVDSEIAANCDPQ